MSSTDYSQYEFDSGPNFVSSSSNYVVADVVVVFFLVETAAYIIAAVAVAAVAVGHAVTDLTRFNSIVTNRNKPRSEMDTKETGDCSSDEIFVSCNRDRRRRRRSWPLHTLYKHSTPSATLLGTGL